MTKAIVKTKISVLDTLLSIPIGKSVEIRSKDIKTASVQTALTRLRKKGYSFIGSTAGRYDGIVVTRVK